MKSLKEASLPSLKPHSEQELRSPARRRFLGRAGSFTAAALATGSVGLAPLTGSPATTAKADVIGPLTAEQRRLRCLQLRQLAAQFQHNQPLPAQIANGDDAAYANRIGSFTKTLPHNGLGEVEPAAYQKYLDALVSGNPAEYEAIPLGGTVKLANPQAALAYDLEGADSHHLTSPPAPRFDSAEAGAEMIEIYWHALLRDVPFSQYGENIFAIAAVNDLQRQPGFAGTTAANLFRGSFPGEEIGPYLSQFLWKPVPAGSMMIDQRYRVPLRASEFMTSYASWLAIQNGAAPGDGILYDATPRYLRNGRDLGEYVHFDYTYQAFLNAALVLLGFGLAYVDDANPYKTSTKQGGFSTFGAPLVLDLVARVANKALRAVWYQKWAVHRRVRPEEYGGRIHNHLSGTARYPLPANVLESPATASIVNRFGTWLLPQAYPEGCPIHPAYPSGHATIAGACVTVLKACFKESAPAPNPVVASDDGLLLDPYDGTLTIGGELNKLAGNIAIGRNLAGVHWRSDAIQGMLLGEAVALSVLNELKGCVNETFEGFSLTKFDGTTIRLNAGPSPSTRFVRTVGRL
ncbi:MAG: vanadium-dependent haloperoxidase [Blastocatellia bacterium]|nr:vanadium-dependent haloperoxidase [Blastocatellia bacterium]